MEDYMSKKFMLLLLVGILYIPSNGGAWFDNWAPSKGNIAGDLIVEGDGTVGGDFAVTGAASGATLDTGQGANELYDMDQNVETDSTPTFSSMTITNGLKADDVAVTYGIAVATMAISSRIAYQTDKYIVCAVFTSTGINACIDALGSEGGEVYLPEGTYTSTTQIVIDYSSTTIMGAGANTILDYSGGQPPNLPCIDTNDKHCVIISNLAMRGSSGGAGGTSNFIGDGDEADFLLVEKCRLLKSDYSAINTLGDAVKITNNYIENSDQSPIVVRGNYTNVSNNIFTGNGGNVIFNNGGDYINIKGNIINGIGAGGYGGIRMDDATYCSIVANIVVSAANSSKGIDVNVVDYCIITDNVLTGGGITDIGIHLDDADECVVVNNFTSNHDVAGIQEDADCQGNLIYSNNCSDTTPYNINGTNPESVIYPSQTEAELKVFTPKTAGMPYYDSSNKAVVISTGATVGGFGLCTDGTQSPTGW